MIKKIFTLLVILLAMNINVLADDLNDIPKEGKTFFWEDMPSGLSKKISRTSSGNPYEVTTTITNCFDESRINTKTNAWFVTSDGSTQLSIDLHFTEDDARYTIASYEISSYFYDGEHLFQDENKELITEVERYVGKYEPTNTEKSITVKWTAPKVYPYTTSPYYTFYMVIKVKFKNGGTAYVGKNLGVSRTGVLLLHGLNDTKKVFEPFREYLVNSDAFIESQIYNMDYENTNTSSFDENTNVNKVVEKGLKELSKSLLEAKIASSKYDMIGHSMGGILERKYIQDVEREHTYRLITLNTPHFGAPLGNIFGNLHQMLMNSTNNTHHADYTNNILSTINNKFRIYGGNNSAVKDLAYNSDAIKTLSSNVSKLYGIPCYAVGSYIQKENQINEDYYYARNISEDATFLMAHIFYNNIPTNRYTFLLGEDVDGDGIVSISSQKGGLTDYYCSVFNGNLKDANHCNSPKWSITQNELRLLLLSYPDENNFCMTGFKGSPTSENTKKVSRATDASSEYIETFAEPKESSFIHINMEKVEGESYTHKATLTHSDDMATTMAFSILSKDRMISGYDQNEMKFDLSDWEGEYTFYAIGRTNYDALVMDSVTVKVNKVTGIEKISSNSANFKYYVNGNNLVIDGIDEEYNVKIWDIAGRIIMSRNSNTSNTYSLPINNGLYVVGLETSNGLKTFKIRITSNAI